MNKGDKNALGRELAVHEGGRAMQKEVEDKSDSKTKTWGSRVSYRLKISAVSPEVVWRERAIEIPTHMKFDLFCKTDGVARPQGGLTKRKGGHEKRK